jgi:hypothetical protein
MSAATPTLARWNEEHAPLRLLERPLRPTPRSTAVLPQPTWRQRLVDAIEAYWAWGEGLTHHRMGSYQQR